jgi:dipeptidyl aminopeptidase/acylaminoacyl peptidase
MRQLGKTVEYVAFVGEGHGFRHTGSQRDLYDRVAVFLAWYNGSKAVVTNTQ